jgi:alanine racemase
MDQIMVDVTTLALSGKLPAIGEEAVLVGRQRNQDITCEELAQWADTISYEMVCSLGSRLPRIYSN